jgi:hypothetical protein
MFTRQALITMDVNIFIAACFAAVSYARWRRGRGPLPRRCLSHRATLRELRRAAHIGEVLRCCSLVCTLLDYCLCGVPKLIAPSPLQLLREHDRAGAMRPVVPSDYPTTRRKPRPPRVLVSREDGVGEEQRHTRAGRQETRHADCFEPTGRGRAGASLISWPAGRSSRLTCSVQHSILPFNNL